MKTFWNIELLRKPTGFDRILRHDSRGEKSRQRKWLSPCRAPPDRQWSRSFLRTEAKLKFRCQFVLSSFSLFHCSITQSLNPTRSLTANKLFGNTKRLYDTGQEIQRSHSMGSFAEMCTSAPRSLCEAPCESRRCPCNRAYAVHSLFPILVPRKDRPCALEEGTILASKYKHNMQVNLVEITVS